MSSLACGLYSMLFLKVWSYVQVNYWCRMASLSRPKGLAKQGRNFSLAEFSTTTPSAGLRPFPTSMKIQKIKFSRAYFDPDMI